MRTTNFLQPAGATWRTLLGLILACAADTSNAQPAQPSIASVRLEGTNVVITAVVSPGLRRVTLECRDRLGAGSWAPRAVTRPDGSGGSVTFRLPRSRPFEVIRVRGDAVEPLPASFFTGTNSFYEQPSAGVGGPRTPGPVAIDSIGASPQEGSREVVESDIWKIRGTTLYFFNQLRGLQVIDVTHPDTAVVRGLLELPAAGEQMYLLGARHIALLARNGCASDESQVLIVADTNGPPAVAARLSVPGFIQESRLVGSALYVASQSFRPVANTTNSTWEWGTAVSSFDLADPGQPAARGTLWYPGYGNVVAATDRLLFVVTQDPTNWWQSTVRSIDITAPDGTMHAYQSIRTAGLVADKFKLNWEGGIFTAISEDRHQNNGTRLVTKLENFRLPDPRSAGPAGVIKLGELALGRGERLRATRFDGQRVYVVTFFQIDPLWVVDNSNSSAPRVAGSVDVPGWSTFIQPLGNRLVTIGIETNHAAVSLFDVQNPATPALLSRVRLGQNSSWSEANWDEKAFSVLPEAGLILVPFTGDTTNGYASRVQLIDLNATTLVPRGFIEHQMAPRRATLYTDRILSLSGWELLSVDPADRDHPIVRGSTPLAWAVDRVFVQGDFLLELAASGDWWWAGQSSPVLRIAPAGSPHQIVNQLALTNLPVLGAVVRGNRLYVAQGGSGWFGPLPLGDGPGGLPGSDASTFLLTIVGLDSLPAVRVLGQTWADVEPLGWGSDLQPVWPGPDRLVWVGGGFNFYPWLDLRGGPVGGAAILGGPWPVSWGGGGGRLLAFDVSDSAAPQLASDINLGTNNWWNFSAAFMAEGLVYLSHQISEYVPGLTGPQATPPVAGGPALPGDPVTNAVPDGQWVSRSFLDVVDYSDARNPLVRVPVSIPGQLNGVSHRGAVLYTVGTHFTTNGSSDWTEFLEASAYDGVSAHRIDSLALPAAWPRPLLVVGTNIFLGRSGYTNGWWGGGNDVGKHTLETWFLSTAGRFAPSGRVTLALPASTLAGFGALLAVQESDNTLALFDASDGRAPRLVGQGRPSGCLGFDLTRADGQLGRGLWLPLGAYGVARIPVAP